MEADRDRLGSLLVGVPSASIEHLFPSDADKLAVLDAALACRPTALRVGADQRKAVEWLALGGLLIEAGDGTVTPTRAAVHYDELVKP